MKKAGNKYLWRSIKKNMVSFFAVSFIAATSIAVFLGLQSAAAAILNEANRYFVSNRLETMEITCANGMTRDDVETISEWEGVDAAEGGYSATVLTNRETERIALQALSLCDEVNVPEVLEGTLPSASDEAAVEEMFAVQEGIQVGDTLTLEHEGELMDAEGNAKEFRVAGVIAHYLPYHLFVTTDSYYESVMGEDADACVYLLKGDIDGLYEQVRDVDGFFSLEDNSAYEAAVQADVGSVNIMIAVCLILSAVMAVLVLLNQIVMHINRKSRELAVMRVNGFTLKETRAYIYRDNIALTVIGFLLGSGFGLALSYVVVRTIETGALRYVRTPNPFACLYACAVGALFALVVNLIALRRIRFLDLTHAGKN